MRRTGSGRVARKIGAYDEDTPEASDASQSGASKDTVVKRPTFAKNRKRSSLRISFGAGDSDVNDGDESSDTAVITPKKSNLKKLAIQQNAERRAGSPLVTEVPRAGIHEDRPTYSKDYLDELRKSTPSTPKDLKPSSDEEEESRTLDIASKFGPVASVVPDVGSAIPTNAEIQEKKARRARLAKEQQAMDIEEDQPWASDDDDEFRTNRNEISLRPKERYAETRLVHDDEDIAEGFDEYVEDGQIALGRKAEREAEKRRRAEMAELINQAERGSDEDVSADSEEERNAAYEAAQTRAGIGKNRDVIDDGARTPPRITPLPDLGDVLEALQADIREKQQRRELMLQKLQELKDQKVRIAERQQYLQEQLQKTGDEYERLRIEAGMAAVNGGTEGGKVIINRGLDSIGTTPLGPSSREDSPEEV